jgi:hypothetical protein
MFHESGYTSISVVGLCVIIIVSAIITIISYGWGFGAVDVEAVAAQSAGFEDGHFSAAS